MNLFVLLGGREICFLQKMKSHHDYSFRKLLKENDLIEIYQNQPQGKCHALSRKNLWINQSKPENLWKLKWKRNQMIHLYLFMCILMKGCFKEKKLEGTTPNTSYLELEVCGVGGFSRLYINSLLLECQQSPDPYFCIT